MYKIGIVTFLLLGLAFPTHAEEADVSANTRKDQSGWQKRGDDVRGAEHAKRPEAAQGIVERRHATGTDMEARREKFEERREKMASTTGVRKLERDEHKRERVLVRIDHITDLLDAIIERLSRIADRIDARIDVLAAAGLDVSAAETALADAQKKIEAAADAVAAVEVEVKAAADAEKPAEAIAHAKQLSHTAKETIRAAHRALIASVHALPKPRSANPSGSETAASTATSTATSTNQ